MNLKIYCIRDVVAGSASIVTTCPNDGMLKRNLEQMYCAKSLNFVNDHPRDKQVYHIGDYDTDTMVVTPHTPDMVLSLLEIEESVIQKLRQKKEQLKGVITDEQQGEIDDEIKRLKSED